MKKAVNLKTILAPAKTGGYAVGSFSPRYTKLIRPVMEAGMRTHSPLIIQISEKEIYRHQVSLKAFSDEFFKSLALLEPDIPIALHLDHTKDMAIIREAMDVGFTSVMIDASELPFEDNVEKTLQVTALAHPKNISVEAELGQIGTTDFAETDTDEEHFTQPEEARKFCELTGVDALAVSVGTAHGLYTTRQPRVDFKRLEEINRLTNTPLVLHGASGVPSAMVTRAATLASGGVCKVNIATDLEQAMLAVLGEKSHMTESQLNAVSEPLLDQALAQVRELVIDKIQNYLLSADKA